MAGHEPGHARGLDGNHYQQGASTRDIPSLPDRKQENAVKVFPGAMFECVRCRTRFSGEELAGLPETTCSNCGYRIFRKLRSRTAKTLKAE